MYNILLVDDIQMQNDLLRMRIDSLGIKINYYDANNGYEALSIFRQNLIDLVIMDHFMPVMTGIEALREMRAINKEIPIFMSSGGCNGCTNLECLKYGVTKILPKPIPTKQLVCAVMQEMCPHRQKNRIDAYEARL